MTHSETPSNETEGRRFISVVIPAFNASQTLHRALTSVFNQHYLPTEVIVVDDGSTDATCDVVGAMTFRVPVRLVRQDNAGVSVARNRGMEMAEGDIIAFLDADDCWTPRHLTTIVRLAGRYPEASFWASSAARSISGSNNSSACGTRSLRKYVNVFCQASYFHLRTDWHAMVFKPNMSSLAVRKNLASAVGGFPVGVAIGEDTSFQIRLAECGPVAVTSRVTVLRFVGHESASSRARNHRNQLPGFERIRDKVKLISASEQSHGRKGERHARGRYRRRYVENSLIVQLPRIVSRREEKDGIAVAEAYFIQPWSPRMRLFVLALNGIHMGRRAVQRLRRATAQ